MLSIPIFTSPPPPPPPPPRLFFSPSTHSLLSLFFSLSSLNTSSVFLSRDPSFPSILLLSSHPSIPRSIINCPLVFHGVIYAFEKPLGLKMFAVCLTIACLKHCTIPPFCIVDASALMGEMPLELSTDSPRLTNLM